MAINIDEYTRIDELLQASLAESQQTLQIMVNTNRQIYEMLTGQTLQSGLLAYQTNASPELSLEEKKLIAKRKTIITDPRDNKAFKIISTIVDEAGFAIFAATRFITGPYTADKFALGQIVAHTLAPGTFAYGSDYAITNIKLIGTGLHLGLGSDEAEFILIRNLPAQHCIGGPIKTVWNFDNNIWGGTYGLKTTAFGVTEIDLSNNPIILRSDLNDTWGFDLNNSNGAADQNFRICITYHLIQPLIS
jgi:hypothetical protein